MTGAIIVTGTDTNIGKTVFAAGLVGLLNADYWKPVQAGLDGDTDSDIVRHLAGPQEARIHPESWRLQMPASPHYAAECQGETLDPDVLVLPETGGRALIVEGAGGLMVPFNRTTLQIDIFRRWRASVVLCARTTLGTINHSLLSIEALRQREMTILGIAFIGDAHPDNERTICEIGGVRHLGRLPWLSPLSANTLRSAFAAAFRREDFAQ